MTRGRFITFEGGEGSGKSTQIPRLAARLKSHGVGVIETREPGGTPGGEAIRRLLVEGDATRWDPMSEALLNFAARRQHLVESIWPALDRAAVGAFQPDLTLIFDVPVALGLERAGIRGGGEDRYERMGADFHERVRDGLLEIAKREPKRCRIIDATADIDAVEAAVVAAVKDALNLDLSS